MKFIIYILSKIDKRNKFYIQDIWVTEFEGESIISSCIKNNIPYEILSREEIEKLEYDCNRPFIADSDVISKFFTQTETYSDVFSGLYGSTKIKTLIGLLKDSDKFPIFVKPVITKVFDGMIVRSKKELNYFNFSGNLEVYTSDIMEIKDETRVLITSDGTFYGEIDDKFKNMISKRLTKDKCYAIDIAWNIDKWIIVECNPCYSLG